MADGNIFLLDNFLLKWEVVNSFEFSGKKERKKFKNNNKIFSYMELLRTEQAGRSVVHNSRKLGMRCTIAQDE